MHIHIEYIPFLCISDIVKRLKGRTSRRLQAEYSTLSKYKKSSQTAPEFIIKDSRNFETEKNA